MKNQYNDLSLKRSATVPPPLENSTTRIAKHLNDLDENHEILADDDKCLIKILPDYRACHRTYKFEISSINLMLADQSLRQIQNPAF